MKEIENLKVKRKEEIEGILRKGKNIEKWERMGKLIISRWEGEIGRLDMERMDKSIEVKKNGREMRKLGIEERDIKKIIIKEIKKRNEERERRKKNMNKKRRKIRE